MNEGYLIFGMLLDSRLNIQKLFSCKKRNHLNTSHIFPFITVSNVNNIYTIPKVADSYSRGLVLKTTSQIVGPAFALMKTLLKVVMNLQENSLFMRLPYSRQNCERSTGRANQFPANPKAQSLFLTSNVVTRSSAKQLQNVQT